MLQVFHEACLVDRLNRAQAHGDGRELPEVGHQPGVRVGRQTLAVDFLAEIFHLLFADAALKEGAGVNAGGGVALEEHQVTAVLVGRCFEEVVKADVVQRGAGGESRDMAAQVRVLLVGTHDHCQCVPAHHRADAAFHEQVARHACFVGNRDGVAIRGSDGVGQRGAGAAGQFTQAGHQVMRAVFAFVVQYGLQCVEPFLRFKRINIVLLHYGLQTLWALQMLEAARCVRSATRHSVRLPNTCGCCDTSG